MSTDFKKLIKGLRRMLAVVHLFVQQNGKILLILSKTNMVWITHAMLIQYERLVYCIGIC